MGPDDNTDDTLEEQTLAFQSPEGWARPNRDEEPAQRLYLIRREAAVGWRH